MKLLIAMLPALAASVLAPLAASATETPYPGARSGHASYEVPVSDDLKPFATYPIKDIRSNEDSKGVVTITYSLPLALTGVKNDIVLKSTDKATDGTYTNFEGPNGSANCDALTCNVRYRDLNLDAAAVRQNFVSQGIGGVELQNRMAVFSSFSGDPAGIIRFDQSSLRR